MGKSGKLELYNSRPSLKVNVASVYNSCEDSRLHRFSDTMRTTHNNFDSQDGHAQKTENVVFHCGELMDPPRALRTGDKMAYQKDTRYYEFVPRPMNDFELMNNRTAQTYFAASRRSKVHVKVGNDLGPDLSRYALYNKIVEGKVPGGHWSGSTAERKPLADIQTHLGPGDYDITSFENGSQGRRVASPIFSSVSSHRNRLIEDPSPSPTTYFRDGLPSSPTIGVKFSTAPRLEDLPRAVAYKKTTGLLLGPNHDSSEHWTKPKANLNLKQQTYRKEEKPQHDYGIDFIDPDQGGKITFKTAIATTPLKYSSPFKSKAPVGMEIPRPATGDIGPGSYGGACDASSLVVKDPQRPHSSFQTKRISDVEIWNQKFNTLKPRFQHRLYDLKEDHFQVINASEYDYGDDDFGSCVSTTSFGSSTIPSERSLSPIALQSKKKIAKMYPRLAKKRFG